MENVQQRVAVVTGGNRSVGQAAARQLAQRGVHVVIAARDVAKGEAAAAEIRAKNQSASFHELDVTSEASVQAFAKHLRQQYGRLDMLINNAGVALDMWVPALELDLAVMQRTFEINVLGAVRVLQALVPLMKEAGSGRVVNLSSQLGSLQDMSVYALAYRSSKASVNAITRVLAAELKEDGILVNAVCPGSVATELGEADAPCTPEQAAQTVVWLATLPEDGPTGGFFQDRKAVPW